MNSEIIPARIRNTRSTVSFIEITMKRTRTNDKTESQNLPWYLQSTRDGDEDEWVIRPFNNKADSMYKNKASPPSSVMSPESVGRPLTSSYIDRHPEEFIVISPKHITKKNRFFVEKAHLNTRPSHGADIHFLNTQSRNRTSLRIHSSYLNTFLWWQTNTSDLILAVLYMLCLFVGPNRIVSKFMAVVSRKSKRWFSLHFRHDFYTAAKTSVDPRRPKRAKQSHDKAAVEERTPCTTPNDLSELVTVDSNSATSKPLDSIDPDSTTLKLSQPPFLRDEEGSLSSCDWNSTSIGLKAKITTNGQTLDMGTNVLYSEMMMRPSTIDLPPSQLLKENIEAISTVLSSSGLNRQSSLKIATQTVIKKLEIDYEHAIREKEEKTKIWIQAQWRLEDRLAEETRQLSHQLDNAYLRVRQTAFSLFPGHHFLICILLSMVIRMFKYHVVKDFIVALVHDQAPSINLMKGLDYLLTDKLCGCRRGDRRNITGFVTDADTGSYWAFYNSVPTLSSMIYYMAPSVSCMVLCFMRYLFLTFLIFTMHWIMSKLYVPNYIHQLLNTATVFLLISLPMKDVFVFIVGGIVFVNISVALAGIAVSHRSAPKGEKLQNHDLKEAVKALNSTIFYMYLASTMFAILLGTSK